MDITPKKEKSIYIHIDGQQTYEKMFNIANYCGNADQNYNEVSPVRVAIMKNYK